MGTFLGHLVPGLALIFLGLWHMINTVRLYYLQGSAKFMLRFWYQLKSPWHKVECLELIIVMSFSILAILIQVFDLQSLRFSFKLDNIEHSTMFLLLLIFEGFSLFSEMNRLSEIMLASQESLLRPFSEWSFFCFISTRLIILDSKAITTG